ncbi:MAG TPA: site-specific integrase [Acidobacteriaceae bacterium]|nr:site-specific integrase [Acidobacteriaceae bacterium]
MIESSLMNGAKQRKLTASRKSVTLAQFSMRFLDWVDGTRLEAKTKTYYHSDWKLLVKTPISKMRIGHITTDDAEVLQFDHSPANANCGLRTLRRMLGKAAEWGLIMAAPRVKLLKEEGRSEIIDAKSTVKLLAVAKQPLHDVAVIVLDCGMRPSEVFEMRWEDLAWDTEMIFIPRGKTKQSRRLLPMSARVREALQARWDGQASGWVFPADSRCGHITTVAKAFQNARKAAGLSKEIVVYSGRHAFGTKLLASTGNLSLVMRAMGHSSVQAAMIYQHPDLETVRSVMNGNTTEITLRHKSRHKAAA